MAGRPAKTFPIIDSKGNVITTVTGWNHGTVADGCELTDMTIDPICSALNNSNDEIKEVTDNLNAEIARAKSAESAISSRVDVFYDEYSSFSARVEQSATNLNNKIDTESARAISAETTISSKLQNQIDIMKGATDVIYVVANKQAFDSWSATYPTFVTDKDFVKVLVDETVSGGAQSYYQSTVNGTTTSWAFATAMPPYYSQAEFTAWSAARFTETSAKYALLAADSQKLGNTAASNIINSAMSGANASAWLNANAYKYISDVLSSNMKYIDGTLVTATNGSARKLTISLSGYQTTGDGTYITGSTNNRLITLKPSDSFIGSAQSGKSAYDWITTKSATLSAGQYIQFTNAAANTLGIKVTGLAPYTNGNYIEVDNSTYKINLSSDISATHISSDNITCTGYEGRGYTAYMDCSSMYFERVGRPGEKVIMTPYDISAYVPDPYVHLGTLTATNSWYNILSNAGGNYVSAASSQSIKMVTANNLPYDSMENGIYYLV